MLIHSMLAATAMLQPSDEEAVLQTVDRFFEAYYDRNVAGVKATLAQGALGHGLVVNGDSRGITAPLDMHQWAESLKTLTTRNNELYWEPKVEIRAGSLAQFWAPYVIEVDGVLTHCGIDAFTLVKAQDEWKLSSLQFTMEPRGCDELGYDIRREGMRPASLVEHLEGKIRLPRQ
ncbi:hypothetical protein [Parvularcula lutaonensis]|uniref:SnoaL-like domain-containing protein n=1 Tax=Parvularcula lutaonensis TaxID=491923 RepID=A0ABV7MCR4_9PROT|nr:hypothetical protein [Parvularcula lutaonensis]GGY40698.1 hypothetical protein GCM10007148_06510 [Parvularcula lutaonensis]